MRTRAARRFPRRARVAALALALSGCGDSGVQVTEGIPVASITIDAVSTALVPGDKIQLTARARGLSGEVLSNRPFAFWIANGTAASVSIKGLLSAVGPGTVTASASAGGQIGSRDITVNYPLPTLTSVSTTSAPGAAAAAVNVRGTGFYAGTVVRLNGIDRPTTPVSTVEARVSLSASDVANIGEIVIAVFNPPPGGGTSRSVPLSMPPLNQCDVVAALTPNTLVNGTLDTGDCNIGTAAAPLYQDSYSFTTTALTAVTFASTSRDFGPFLFVPDPANDAALRAIEGAYRLNPAFVRVLLPAGKFAVASGTVASGAVGAYALTSTISSAAAITNCETWYVVPGLDLEQTITPQDCEDPDYGDYRWDEYKIALRAGQTVTITLESTTFDAELWLFDSNLVAHDDNGGGGTNARIVFTASVAGIYEFELGPSLTSGGPVIPTGTGAYTLRIR